MNFLKNLSRKQLIGLALFFVLAIGIPVVLFQLNRQQDIRQRASETNSVNLYFNPTSGTYAVGQEIAAKVKINAGSYDITGADVTITLDSSLDYVGYTLPTTGLTNVVIPPAYSSSTRTVRFVVTRPATADVISGTEVDLGFIKVKGIAEGIALLKFKPDAIEVTAKDIASTIPLTFTDASYTIGQVNSTPIPTSSVCGTIATNPKGADLAAALAARTGLSASFWLGQLTPQLASGVFSPDEIMNALNSDYTSITYSTDPNRPHSLWLGRIPGAMQGQPGCTGVPPVSLSTTPTGTAPTSTPRPIASPTAAITPVTTPGAGANITLNLKLPGIGSGSGSNTAPKRTTRTASVALFDATGQPVKTVTAAVSYDGAYYGLIPLGTLTPGSYEAKVKLDNTLWKRIPGILTISAGNQVIQTSQLDLISGDISGTVNLIDVSDYSDFLTCYAGTCDANIKTLADFNDDGTVDAKDLNILLRAFANRQGD